MIRSLMRYAALVGVLAPALTATAQITVVDMTPASNSGETSRDAEPSIAGDPTNPQLLAGTAFTPDPGGTLAGVIYFSTDSGDHWSLTPAFLPGSAAVVPTTGYCFATVCDVSLRFSGTTSRLYLAKLTKDTSMATILDVGRVDDLTLPSVAWTQLDTRSGSSGAFHDQPWVQAITVLEGAGTGDDRTYVSLNNISVAPLTAGIDFSLNPTPPPPAGFNDDVIETVTPSGQDAPPVRVAVHLDGTVYGAFTRWTSSSVGDVVVVRDDGWGSGATPFRALHDATLTTQVGQRVVTGVTTPGGSLGNQRVTNTIALAIDPSDSKDVYIAWTDGAASSLTVHVRRSQDQGQHWSTSDLFSVSPATNPGLAVNSLGKVALLYQRLATGSPNRWETHLRRSSDGFATAPSDAILANAPDAVGSYTGSNVIGDYAGVIALGKSFYGIFSAFNTADTANFPSGITYARYHDFTTHHLYADAARTMVVSDSVDPYFFRSTELAADHDYYVRDWILDAATNNADQGQEPSTQSVFWTSSDVWNRASDTPGSAASSGAFPTDPMQAGTGAAGDNWAFARVRRAAGGSTASVTLHFLVSPFGTGSNFQDAGTDPDPTLSFGASDQELVMATGYHWHQDPTASTHACMAVQISTADDPYIQPGLAGTAPGWPSGVAVVEDDNKAQRNLDVSHNLADFADIAYALVHNGATFPRDIVLRMTSPDAERLREAEVVVAGGQGTAFKSGGTVTLPKMLPGENRWLGVKYRAGAGRDLPIHFHELDRGRVVNGFTVVARPIGLAEKITDDLRQHAIVFRRLSAAFQLAEGDEEATAAQKLLANKPTPDGYVKFVRERARAMAGAVAKVPAAPGDPFELGKALEALAAATTPSAMASQHGMVLRRMDALITAVQKAGGDAADIAQMVRWQMELYQGRTLHGLSCARQLIERSRAFLGKPRPGPARADSYAELIREGRGCYRAAAAREKRPELQQVLAALEKETASAPLEKAHRAFLLALDPAVRQRR